MKLCTRIMIYISGLFIITIGINLSILSQLGISPVSAFTYPLSQATRISLGVITTATYSVLVLLQWLMLQKKFTLKHLLQIPFSICFGYFVDLTGQMLAFIDPQTYLQQCSLMLLGIVICSIGASMYILMDLVPNAPEGFNLAISERFQMPFSKSKILADCLFISIGCVISMLTVGRITMIREGTVLSALLTGKLIGLISQYAKPTLIRIAFSSPAKLKEA